ncbi:MAG: rhodanese-like domain-containing protein [Roseimicrobium sp.]
MKTRLFLHLVAACFCGVVFASDPTPNAVTHVDANGAQKLIESGKVLVLDVRTQDEFAEGHIAGAKVVDFTESDFEQKAAALDRKQAYLVHCAAGGRSTNSLAVFRKLGFSSIYHLDGGFKAWQKAGKPVAK